MRVLGTTLLLNVAHVGLVLASGSKSGAVVSGSAVCSRIGADALKAGGNAADAVIATEFCLSVLFSYATGLGGGGFGLVRSASGQYECIDFRETAPAAATEDMFKNNEDASLRGGLASGVPGTLRGLEYMHRKYGSQPWAQLIQPSIKLASEGFEVDEDLVSVFKGLEEPSFLVDDPSWAADFAPDGKLPSLGGRISRRRYAKLLQDIADHGADAFYSGPNAEATIDALKAANGTMSLQDLANYSVVTRDPVKIQYREFELTGCGAPAGGGVVLSIMKTAEGYILGAPDNLNSSSHRLIEAMRFGYGARTQLGDPSFVQNMTSFQVAMLSKEKAENIRRKISDETTLPVGQYNPDGLQVIDTFGTSHVSTADASGMTISPTSTVNLWFGSQLMVPETGLVMNNEMNDFSIPGVNNAFGYPPSPSNFIRPGKRPLSSMSPTIIEFCSSGKVHSALGAAGGSRIITAIVQALWAVLDRGMCYSQALDMPRFHNQLQPNVVELEHGFDNATAAFLASRNHKEKWTDRESDMHALWTSPDGDFGAAAEPGLHNAGGAVV